MIATMERHHQEFEERAVKLGMLFAASSLLFHLNFDSTLLGTEMSRQRDEEWRQEVTRKFEQKECELQVIFSGRSQSEYQNI
jgi:hypothetical protein